jgi:Ala-tRNA(Pro) deacylase
MAISQRLKAFLDGAKVKYTAARHPVVYTAQEIAAAQHIPGRQLAKCVLVKTDRGPVLAVLPASHLIDLPRLKALLRVKALSLAKEADIKALFPDVEVGAMSPFGNLYGVPVAVDRPLGESEQIAFNAGSHADTVKMRYVDFARLVKAKTGAFGRPAAGPKPKKSGATRPAKKAAAKRPAKKPSRTKKAGRR